MSKILRPALHKPMPALPGSARPTVGQTGTDEPDSGSLCRAFLAASRDGTRLLQVFKRAACSALSLTVLAVVSLTTACSSQHIANEAAIEDMAAARAQEMSGDRQSALEQAEKAIRDGEQQQLAFLTPLHWERMQAAIKEARQDDLESDDEALVISAARVLSLHDSAMQRRRQVETQLEPLLLQRQVLLDVRADRVLSRRFRELDDDIRLLAKRIEADQQSDIDERIADLATAMQHLERDTLLEIHWRPAQQTLERAESEDLDRFAPKTFGEAEELLAITYDTISAHYSNRDRARDVGLEALRAAQHALYIGRESEKLVSLDNEEAEAAALLFEDYLHQLATALGARDLRNMALLDQTLALIQQAKQNQAPLRARITELEQALKQAQATANDSATVDAAPDSAESGQPTGRQNPSE